MSYLHNITKIISEPEDDLAVARWPLATRSASQATWIDQ